MAKGSMKAKKEARKPKKDATKPNARRSATHATLPARHGPAGTKHPKVCDFRAHAVSGVERFMAAEGLTASGSHWRSPTFPSA